MESRRLLQPMNVNEFALRSDGGNADIGYPWSAQTPDGRILVVYYFNEGDGTRYIAGAILQI